MRIRGRVTELSRSAPVGQLAGRALAAFVLVAGFATGARAQTPAGTQITAQAQVTYEDPAGVSYSDSSGVVTVTVAQVAGVDVEAPRTAVAGPGANVVFAHTLVNIGNGTDTITVSSSSAAGWPVVVRRDVDADGALGPGDPVLSGPVTLAMGDTIRLLLVVPVPPGAGAGTRDTITLAAQSGFNPAVTDDLQDEVSVLDAGIAVGLTKSVDRPSATTGDILTYSLAYSATGSVATEFELRDAIPFGAAYVPGTLRLNGVPLSDASGDDAGHFDAAGPRAVVRLDTIQGGDAGSVTFQVTPVAVSAPAILTNIAVAAYRTVVGLDSVVSNAVQTTVVLADVAVAKQLLGPATARIGEPVSYTIRYRNDAAVVARAVTLSDTLPAGLEFVAALPTPVVTGQTLTWALGDVAPGDSAEISITTRVAASVQDTVQVTNVAFLASLNAPVAAAAAVQVQLIGASAAPLALELSADVLEVGLGETAPYTATLENSGAVPVADLRIAVTLAPGARYARGSAIGVDSVQATPGGFTLFVPGSLAPGGRTTLRFATAIVSPNGDVVVQRATASADAGALLSAEAVAWVRVRRAWPMETRAAIGKVYSDANLNGRQDAGEQGVEGVDVWSDDGEVATTDADGKFSLRNVRPGRHAFRLDATTLPATYRVPGVEDLVVTDADGWTTPRISFRLLPTAATPDAVLLPVAWRLTVRPISGSRDAAPPATPVTERRTLARFETNRSQPILAFENRLLQIELPRLLAQRRECFVEIVGHADRRPVHGGPYRDNQELSIARAESVSVYLRRLGVAAGQIRIQGAADSLPVAGGRNPQELRWNRRTEVQLVCAAPATRGRMEYEVVLDNPYDVPLSGFAVRFAPAADSAVVSLGGAVVARSAGARVALPDLAPRSRLVVHAWADRQDSVSAVVEGGHRAADLLAAEVHNPLRPVEGVTSPRARTTALPNTVLVPVGATVDVALAPAVAGWPDVVYAPPAGWEFVPGSVRLGAVPAADPAPRRDRSGQTVLAWRFATGQLETVSLALRPVRPVESQPVRLPPLRSDADRAAEGRRGLVAGPGVAFVAPVDGAVQPSDRLYVGVRGEPGAPVALFDGDSLIAEAVLRIDGVHDFIAVALARGPHRLRVRMLNSWRQERWDSLAVHVTGLPARFEVPAEPVLLAADGQTVAEVRVRVLDGWGVPVAVPTNVSVTAKSAQPAGPDADPSSVGLQVRTDRAGWTTVALRAGREVGRGSVELRVGDARGAIALELAPPMRPLMVTGIGQVGFGASADAFGSLTARGRLDRRTAVVLSYDSRRLDAGRDAFGRAFDPLEESQYPILGDASRTRTLTPSRTEFAARLERGLDWVALGDVSTALGTDLQLTRYQRALTGGAARVTTGPVTWQGFGSLTRQDLRQTQLRGAGASGPYTLQPDIVPGTEQVVLETRARDNAQRTVTRQALVRFVDYEVDYARGTVLFKRPVPAADAYENPVFIVVTYEARGVGDQRWVAGLRATVDARVLASRVLDSVRIGGTSIRAEEPAGAQYLLGADLRLLRVGALDVRAEMSYSENPDSSGAAGTVDGAVHLFDGALDLHAAWTRIGAGYANASNTALLAGTAEVRAGGALTLGASTLRVEHERQDFGLGLERERTRAAITQGIGRTVKVEAGHTTDRFENGSAGPDRSQAAEVAVRWTALPALQLWADGRGQIEQSGTVTRPDHIGAGASLQVNHAVKLELAHRHMVVAGADDYAVTSLGARATIGSDLQAWSSYQLLGGASGLHNAAVLGLNNRIELGAAWRLHTSFERRVGLDGLALTDPARALPFAQVEENYWAAGLGVELLPSRAPYRLSLRGEYRDGAVLSTQLATFAGELAASRSLAVLSRQEYRRSEQIGPTGATLSRRLASLWGLALRPIGTDAVNVLTRLSWVDESNPAAGGVLTAQGDEQRLIGAAEVIWAPSARSEVAVRYAVRHTQADRPVASGGSQHLASWAEYAGARGEIAVAPWLALRGEGRLLLEHESGARRWDAAPALVIKPLAALEVTAGYRVGDLRDPDFAVRGGPGWFVTIGARISERAVTSAADFWRPRFGTNR